MTTEELWPWACIADKEEERGHQSKLVLQHDFAQKTEKILNPSGCVIRNSVELFNLGVYSLSQVLEYSLSI